MNKSIREKWTNLMSAVINGDSELETGLMNFHIIDEIKLEILRLITARRNLYDWFCDEIVHIKIFLTLKKH